MKTTSNPTISDAMAAMNAARLEIENLKKVQAAAQNAVNAAKKDVNQASSKNKSDKPNYSDQTYWDNRYKSTTNKSNEATYEWYLSFEVIYKYLKKDLLGLKSIVGCKFLVSGCGDSTLCEDLSRAGHKHVAGMDYSDVVIETMSKRALKLNMKGILYFTADACNMHSETAHSYDVVVDKGTLDAIASSGSGDSSRDATQYVREMWRVLVIGGLFVLITTMPPKILQSIAIDPLLSGGSSGTRPVNWESGHVCHQLQTPEGGDVYYYCLRKMADLATNSAANYGGNVGGDKEDIMSGILALLEEAKAAREAVDEAARRQSTASSALSEAEARRLVVEQRLDRDLSAVERQAASSDSDGGGEPSASSRKPGVVVKLAESAALAALPSVQLAVDLETSQCVAGGHLDVFYLLKAGDKEEGSEWDEDDALAVVCASNRQLVLSDDSTPGSSSPLLASLHADGDMYLKDDQANELFEYTVQPTLVELSDPMMMRLFPSLATGNISASEKYYLGQMKVPLPAFSCRFHVSYVRTVTHTINTSDPDTGNTAVEFKRIPLRLAQSEQMAIRCPVYFGRPDGTSSKDVGRKNAVPKRRGTGDVSSKLIPLDFLVEDMQAIGALSVSASLPPLSSLLLPEGSRLSRVLMWMDDSTSDTSGDNEKSTGCVDIVVEMDVVALSPQTTVASDAVDSRFGARTPALSVKTVYYQASLALSADRTGFSLSRADPGNSWVEVDEAGRIVCRVSYRSAGGGTPSEGSKSSNSSTESDPRSLSLSCRFCDHPLLRAGSLEAVRPMPSGAFDSMMHDFICCEDVPVMALTSSEVVAQNHALLYADNYLAVHPSDTVQTAYGIECKLYSSLLDLYSGYGGAIATAPLFEKRKRGDVSVVDKSELARRIGRGLKGAINADCCAILCTRCRSYLGDGQLNKGAGCDPEDCVHPSVAETAGGDRTGGVSSAATLDHSDVSDLRFARQCVKVSGSLKGDSRVGDIRAEQAVSRAMCHLQTVYGVSSFVFYLGDRPSEEEMSLESWATTTSRRNPHNRVVAIKLVNKDCRAALSAVEINSSISVLTYMDCVKVSFAVGDISDVLAGNEARIPLQYHEFRQILQSMEERSRLFGKSMFKDQKLTVLAK